jgi:hypothetical protein
MAELKLQDVAMLAPDRIRTIVKAPLAPVKRLVSRESSRRAGKSARKRG